MTECVTSERFYLLLKSRRPIKMQSVPCGIPYKGSGLSIKP